jgi:hypothetical protein
MLMVHKGQNLLQVFLLTAILTVTISLLTEPIPEERVRRKN